MTPSTTASRVLVVAVVLALSVGTLPATALADDEESVGGTVVVAADETVDSIDAFAGSVVVEGTVTGDVSAVAGSVYVDGTVEGDVDVVGGNLEIHDAVDGDVSVASGSLLVGETGSVGGDVDGAAGSAVIDGTVDGDATLAAETTLGPDASIGGDLTYAGDLAGNTDAVAGAVIEDDVGGISTVVSVTGPGFEIVPPLPSFPQWLSMAYAFALNLLLGAVLLTVFPRFSAGVVEQVTSDPVRTGLAGAVVLVAVPLALVALAITIVGIPLTIAGAFAFAFVAWIAVVYGRYAVAAWLLQRVDVEDRWIALVAGLAGGAALSQVPFVGGLGNLLLFVLGLGALTVGLYRLTDRDTEPPAPG